MAEYMSVCECVCVTEKHAQREEEEGRRDKRGKGGDRMRGVHGSSGMSAKMERA